MPRGSSLYDRFQLSNSTAIPVYQGSAAPEMLKVADYKQGLYNQVQESALALDTNLDNMKGHPGDQAVVDETRNLYKQKLREATDAGNLEDLVPQMHQLGAQYVNDANAINAIQVGRQDYVKNQLESKELNLTGEQKEDFLGMSERAYTDPNNPNKLHRNERGQLVGGYSGVRVAKNIDLNKWVRENAKDIVATKLGREYYQGQNGEWLVKHGDKTETVDPLKIRDVLYKAMLNDPEVQGYLDMEGRRAEYHGQNTSADQVPDKINGKTNMLKQQAIENAKALGTTFGEQYGKLAKPATIDQISRRAFDIGAETYGHRDVISTMDMSVNQLTQERNKAEKDNFRLAGPGSDTAPDWAIDPQKLTDEITRSQTVLEGLNQELAIADAQLAKNPQDIQAQTKRDRLFKQVSSTETVLRDSKARWTNTQDQAVKDLRMDDGHGKLATTYREFVSAQKARIDETVKKTIPKGLRVGNSTITPDEMAEAIADNRIEAKQVTEKLSDRASREKTIYELVRKDGTRVNLTDAAGGDYSPTYSKLLGIKNDIDNEVGAVRRRAFAIHKDITAKSGTISNAVGFDEQEQKAIGDYGTAGATIYKTPGSNQVYTDEDVRGMRFVPEKLNVESGRITGKFKDKDGNFTAPMDILMTTNINSELKSRLARNNADHKWDNVIEGLDDYSYSGRLTKVKDNTVLTGFPDERGLSSNTPMKLKNGKQVQLMKDSQPDGSREWVLAYMDGTVVVNNDGDQYRTPSISRANSWLQQLKK